MATTPEEFFAEGLTDPSLQSPAVFLDLPPTPDGCQDPLLPDGMALSYISRMLMEEDTDDKLLYQYSDHPALLQVQQPFAQILSSPSSRVDHDNTSKGNTEGVKDLFQNNNGHKSTLDSAFSKGVDAVGAFLKGMEEANMFLPNHNGFRRDEVNRMCRESNSHCGVKKRDNRNTHQDEVSRASKAIKMMEQEETGAPEMVNEMMFHGYEICIMGMENLRVSMVTESQKNNRKSISEKTRGMVDLHTLLILCAQAVSANNHMSALELLKQIKKHASESGDATQRLAQCFAKGLEARLVGMGSHLWELHMKEHPSVMEFLQAYKLYLAAGCFIKVAVTYLIMTIMHAMIGKSKLHIVDYGPHFGFHLAGLLRLLANREGVPPEVKVTAIGCPNLRSCPTEPIEDTGIRLSKCAREFGLPFKFEAIMMKSEKVCTENLRTDDDEVLVINDLFNFSTLMDESVFFDHPSPRDTVLNNIRNMRPNVFIQSIVNYSCGSSFLSRFRGTLFYYTALFDMLDATIPRENKLRIVLEQGLLGHAALNSIACEGMDLVDRPEKYRQWQVRNQRAGLRQLPLKPRIVKELKEKVKKGHHNDFLISEDGQWLLQGWAGQILFAHSTWVAEDAPF
ncbi:unnamed protein product [Urochloa decumbens]|uniref:Scarecrow-like protein 9 n=1 Tax=Urochloa decumbens TaxID=240449 RepID=A0ABC9APB5_9POAL